jgi:hypothetical protein
MAAHPSAQPSHPAGPVSSLNTSAIGLPVVVVVLCEQLAVCPPAIPWQDQVDTPPVVLTFVTVPVKQVPELLPQSPSAMLVTIPLELPEFPAWPVRPVLPELPECRVEPVLLELSVLLELLELSV